VLINHAHCDTASVGKPKHIRLAGAVVADQRSDVIGQQAGLQRSDGKITDRRSSGTAATATQVEYDDVGLVGKLRYCWEQVGVIPGWSAMHDDEHRKSGIAEPADEQLDAVYRDKLSVSHRPCLTQHAGPYQADDLPGVSAGHPCPLRPHQLGVEADVLDANDLLAVLHGNGVPDRHTFGGQVRLVRTRGSDEPVTHQSPRFSQLLARKRG
jgi:hypothetical protein